MYVNF
jgi:hypothetical protein